MTKLFTQSEILGKANLPHAWFVAACAEAGIRPTRIGPSLCYPHDALVLAMNRRRFLDSPEGKQQRAEARRANCAVARAKLREMVRGQRGVVALNSPLEATVEDVRARCIAIEAHIEHFREQMVQLLSDLGRQRADILPDKYRQALDELIGPCTDD